jgi:uncharacterized membrane protein (DUF373 family)
MFERVEKYAAIALLVLMGVVVFSAIIEVAWVLLSALMEPPGFFLGVTELFDVFGLFLMVLIGLELMSSVHMFMKDHMIHAEMMFLVAMTAVARKIVIMDSTNLDPMTVFAIGFLVLALSGGYYLVKARAIAKGQ